MCLVSFNRHSSLWLIQSLRSLSSSSIITSSLAFASASYHAPCHLSYHHHSPSRLLYQPVIDPLLSFVLAVYHFPCRLSQSSLSLSSLTDTVRVSPSRPNFVSASYHFPRLGQSSLFLSSYSQSDDDEVMLNVLRCQLTYKGQVVTNAEARFNNSLRRRKPEGSLGRTAQDVHLDSHTAPEL